MKSGLLGYCSMFFLLFNGAAVNAFVNADTIVLNRISTPKKVYHLQPLLLKTNPLAVLWGPIPYTSEYRLVAEITTSRTSSAQIGISYLGKSPLWKSVEKVTGTPMDFQLKIEGWRIQAAQRFYLISRRRYAPFGFYVSPQVSYSNAHISIGLERYYNNSYFDFRHFNANLLIGVQMGRNSRITVDFFGGLGYKSNKVFYHFNDRNIKPYNTEDFGVQYNSPYKITVGINFGLALY